MKRIFCIVAAVLMIFTAFPGGAAADTVQLSERSIFIDGIVVPTDGAKPEIVNGRVMIPIANVARVLGATIEWNAKDRSVNIIKISKKVVLTIDKDVALINGEETKLDVAPYIKDGRTMMPVRFVAEQFGQKVTWDAKNRTVRIEQDRSFEGDSNIRAWIIGCGAVLAAANNRNAHCLGTYPRTEEDIANAKNSLEKSWNVFSRDDLLGQIISLAYGGHNASFMEEAEFANSMSDAEFKEQTKDLEGVEAYMWPMVRELGQKWGDKGIAAWDWYRAAYLCGMGYQVGYLEIEEAYQLAEPFAELLRETFSSWDEATDNYMDGYAYRSRTDINSTSYDYERRKLAYERVKAADAQAQKDGGELLMDPAVWKEPVRGIKTDEAAPAPGNDEQSA